MTTPTIRTYEKNDLTWYAVSDISREFGFGNIGLVARRASEKNHAKFPNKAIDGQITPMRHVTFDGLIEIASANWTKPHLQAAADRLHEWIEHEQTVSSARRVPINEINSNLWDNQKKVNAMTTAAPVNQSTQIFNFEGQQVRTVLIDNEPWFVLSDLAKVMGITGLTKLKKRLDQQFLTQGKVLNPKDGKNYTSDLVNESNMYRVIMRSDKPEAIKFQNWVTDEVIPAIRKHGVNQVKVTDALGRERDTNIASQSGLIPLTENDEGATAVMGRDLHQFLEVKSRYNDWFNNMLQYGFSAGQDFYSISSKTPTAGGRPRTDHIMTMDMAKEVSMIQRTEKGKQARQYFIECEKQYRQGQTLEGARGRMIPTNFKEALEVIIQTEEQYQALEAEKKTLEVYSEKLEEHNEKLQPKADNYDAWIDGRGVFLLGNVAKLLDEGRNIIGQNRLFKFLREEGILISGGQRHNIPQQKYMKHFKVKTRVLKTFDGDERVSMTTYVKPSGVEFIAKRLRNAGIAV